MLVIMNRSRTRQGTPRLAAVVALSAIVAVGAESSARRTPLLEVDLKSGKRKKIDRGGPSSAADRALDSMLDDATGGGAFSTTDLEKIERALRRYLRTARPRAMPRLLLFLYPGRVTRARLKEMREVLVDVDLVVDPCGRSVCHDSVAKHIELLGRAMKQAVIRTSRYRIRFKTITIRASQRLRGDEYEVFRFTAGDVVASGRTRGGGVKLVKQVTRAKDSYDRAMTRKVARRVKLRRVPLAGAPRVTRSRSAVQVALALRSDRVRYRGHVLGALIGAAEALRSSPLTPSRRELSVAAAIRFRRLEKRRFSCTGEPLDLHLRGRLGRKELWNSFVVEHKKGGKRLSFSDAEAAGRGGGTDRGPDRTREILTASFDRLAPCLQAEARRNRRFRGVTLRFAVSGQGTAISIGFKERRLGRRVKRCLTSALRGIRFQRHGGAPRRVEFPMYIQR